MTKEEYLNHVMNNELRNRDPDIYDIEDAYIEGYKEAFNNVVEWLEKETPSLLLQSCDLITSTENFVREFKKAMKLLIEK